MKLVYTQENRLFVSNAKNLLEQYEIKVILKNEFSIGALGESPAFGTWMELWVNDSDFSRARNLLDTELKQKISTPWQCISCDESNDAEFNLCWNCQKQRLDSFPA